MRDMNDDVNSKHSKALQNLLLYVFSVEAVGHAAAPFEDVRANAKMMQAAIAVGMVERVTYFSSSTMSKAIGSLLQTEASTSIAEFQSLVAHVATARLLALLIDEILGSESMPEEYMQVKHE